MVDVITQEEMRNYYLMRLRKPKDTKQINVFFHIEDDEMYAIVDLETAIRGKQFITRKITGINWETDDGDWRAFFRKKKEAKAFIKSIAQRVTISNMDEVKESFDDLVIRRRSKT